MDAGYGNNSDLRADITALQLTYVAGIQSNTTAWAAGTGPLPAKKWSGRGRPPKRLQRDAEHWPVSVKNIALGLPERRRDAADRQVQQHHQPEPDRIEPKACDQRAGRSAQ